MVDAAAFTLPYDSALCEALADAGHDVTLYTTRFAHGPMPEARGYRIVEWFYRRAIPGVSRRASRALQHPFDMWRLRRHLRRSRPDVVHVQWSVVDSFDIGFWRKLDLPVVFTAHNALPREDKGETLDADRLRAFDAVVVHSAYGEQGLRERVELPHLWRIPHGALDAYSDLADPAELPLQLDDGPVVAMTGLLRPYKGVDVLLAAWPRVRELVPNAQLVIAGRPMGVELPATPPAGAQFLPRFVSDEEYAWILRRADIVCLPYTTIDLSGVLFSALALGRPLVLSDNGGFREFDGHGARLVPTGDADALATTLAQLLGDEEARARLAGEAARAAREVYSWSSIAQQYGRRYAELVS